MTRAQDPVKKIVLADGSVRWKFTIDVGRKADGRRDQRKLTFGTQREARQERARILSEVGKGVFVKPDRSTTVAQVAQEWLESKSGKRAATQRSYADALRPVLQRYGSMAVQKLDSTHVEKVKGAMLSGDARKVGKPGTAMSARSINLMLVVTRAMLDHAMKRGLVPRNVAMLVESVASDARPGAAWTPAQLARFLDVASRDRFAAAWRLTTYGLRRGEVLGLEWSRVDLDAREIFIGGPTATRTVVAGEVIVGPVKTKRGERTIPIDDALVAELKEFRQRQRKERMALGEAYWHEAGTGLVVIDKLGRPIRPEAYSDRFREIAKQAGVPAIRLHDARHTSVTSMRERGVPDDVVAQWHGHDENVMRAVYTHSRTEAMRTAVFGG
jgi:integrase